MEAELKETIKRVINENAPYNDRDILFAYEHLIAQIAREHASKELNLFCVSIAKR